MAVNNNDSGVWQGWTPRNIRTTNNSGASNNSAQSRTPNNDLGRDAFLMLLLTQLQFQDPLNPMENHEFVAQMAQFSALEQMQNMNQSIMLQQANSMLGRWVEGTHMDDGSGAWNNVSGFVESVVMRGGEPHLRIGDSLLPVSRVQSVYPDLFLDTMSNLSRDIVVAQNLSIMGRHVMAVRMDGPPNDRRPVEFIEGVVSEVRFDSAGRPILVINGQEVHPGEIFSVSDSNRMIGRIVYTPNETPVAPNTQFTRREVLGIRFERGATSAQDRTFMVLSGDPNNVEHEIGSISLVADALGYYTPPNHRTITHGTVTGEVRGIRMIGQMPHLVVRTAPDVYQNVNFSAFRNRVPQ